jgi:hypothetical protein
MASTYLCQGVPEGFRRISLVLSFLAGALALALGASALVYRLSYDNSLRPRDPVVVSGPDAKPTPFPTSQLPRPSSPAVAPQTEPTSGEKRQGGYDPEISRLALEAVRKGPTAAELESGRQFLLEQYAESHPVLLKSPLPLLFLVLLFAPPLAWAAMRYGSLLLFRAVFWIIDGFRGGGTRQAT